MMPMPTPFKKVPFVLLALSSACTMKQHAKSGGKQVPVVEVFAVAPQEAPEIATTTAVLVGHRQVDVFSKVSGRISDIARGEGDKVRKGDLLFRVDRSDPGENFLATPILSPIEGWVGRWIIKSIGQQVGPTEAVVTVVDDQKLHAHVALPEADWVRINSDSVVEINAHGQKVPAKVLSVARSADPQSGRGNAVVELTNQDRALRSGIGVTVTFQLERKTRLVIPTAALQISSGGSFVYKVEDNKALRQAVTFKLRSSDEAEITSGVAAGDQLIVSGTNAIFDKAPVQIAAKENKSKDQATP